MAYVRGRHKQHTFPTDVRYQLFSVKFFPIGANQVQIAHIYHQADMPRAIVRVKSILGL